MARLHRSGRIPAVHQPQTTQPITRPKAALTLRAVARAGDPELSKWDEVIQYEVRGLPTHEQAWLANFGGRNQQSWRILRAKNGVQSDWTGDYVTAELALAILIKELETHMRHIETMKGAGTVTANSGEKATVRHELHVHQQETPAGTMSDPHASIPGLKKIRGSIEPVCFFGENGLTLEMQDGRKLKFFFTDSRGSIALNSWIG